MHLCMYVCIHACIYVCIYIFRVRPSSNKIRLFFVIRTISLVEPQAAAEATHLPAL